MSDQLLDGKGRGYLAEVSNENKLQTNCVSETVFHHTNHVHGEVYHMLFDKAPTANDDCIVYIKNTKTETMIINGVMMAISGACEVTWKLSVTGTPIGGTDVTPANMNAGSGNEAEGIFQHGVDITGLSNGNNIFVFKFTGALKSTNFQPDGDIILPTNSTFAIYVDTAAIIVEGHVGFGYHD